MSFARQARDPRQEARDTVRVQQRLVVRPSPHMSGESVAFVASVAAVKTDAEMRKAPAG